LTNRVDLVLLRWAFDASKLRRPAERQGLPNNRVGNCAALGINVDSGGRLACSGDPRRRPTQMTPAISPTPSRRRDAIFKEENRVEVGAPDDPLNDN
jgi:hypothetical protein